jgi:hypothetical protein
MRNRLARCLLWIVLAAALAGAFTGCATSDTIVQLPPPENLPDLDQLEQHLDYKDPDDGQPTYVPRREAS